MLTTNNNPINIDIYYWAIPHEIGYDSLDGEDELVNKLSKEYKVTWEGRQGDCGGGLYELIISVDLLKDVMLPLTLAIAYDAIKNNLDKLKRLFQIVIEHKEKYNQVDIGEISIVMNGIEVKLMKVSHIEFTLNLNDILENVSLAILKLCDSLLDPKRIIGPICDDYDYSKKQEYFELMKMLMTIW